MHESDSSSIKLQRLSNLPKCWEDEGAISVLILLNSLIKRGRVCSQGLPRISKNEKKMNETHFFHAIQGALEKMKMKAQSKSEPMKREKFNFRYKLEMPAFAT